MKELIMNHSWPASVTGNSAPLFFILGPCAMENEQHTMMMAEALKKLSEKLNFKLVFKASYDKANRTSLENYRSLGMDEGLRILEKVRNTFQVPVITDVHEVCQVGQVASVVDIIQIPAFLSRQTDLLQAVGKTGKPVHLKKGQFMAPANLAGAIKKVTATGNEHVWLCERGYTFGYNNLIVDYRNFPIMKQFGYPVVFDVTHSVQQPGGMGCSTGGDRNFVPPLAVAAVSLGLAGIFMETHENPDKALSDGPNSIKLADLENLLRYLIDLDAWVKARPAP